MGACVHYLAVGKAPIESTETYEGEVRALVGGTPTEAVEYSGAGRYYSSRVPRKATPINLSQEQQSLRAISPGSRYNPTYSDKLNAWMMRTLNRRPRLRPSALFLVDNMIPEATNMLTLLSGQAGLFDLEIKFEG